MYHAKEDVHLKRENEVHSWNYWFSKILRFSIVICIILAWYTIRSWPFWTSESTLFNDATHKVTHKVYNAINWKYSCYRKCRIIRLLSTEDSIDLLTLLLNDLVLNVAHCIDYCYCYLLKTTLFAGILTEGWNYYWIFPLSLWILLLQEIYHAVLGLITYGTNHYWLI